MKRAVEQSIRYTAEAFAAGPQRVRNLMQRELCSTKAATCSSVYGDTGCGSHQVVVSVRNTVRTKNERQVEMH